MIVSQRTFFIFRRFEYLKFKYLLKVESDVEQPEEDEWYTHDKKNSLTIKNASPFTKVFENIQKDSGVDNESGEENVLYNPDFIQFSQNFFMPYIFIWGGYIFREMDPDYSIVKTDHGCIEKYFSTTKRVRGHIPIVPAKHVLLSFKTVIASCVMFTDTKQKSQKEKSKADKQDCKYHFPLSRILISLKFFYIFRFRRERD